MDKKEFLEIITERADRQCETYELLDEEIRKILDCRIAELWNIDENPGDISNPYGFL